MGCIAAGHSAGRSGEPFSEARSTTGCFLHPYCCARSQHGAIQRLHQGDEDTQTQNAFECFIHELAVVRVSMRVTKLLSRSAWEVFSVWPQPGNYCFWSQVWVGGRSLHSDGSETMNFAGRLQDRNKEEVKGAIQLAIKLNFLWGKELRASSASCEVWWHLQHLCREIKAVPWSIPARENTAIEAVPVAGLAKVFGVNLEGFQHQYSRGGCLAMHTVLVGEKVWNKAKVIKAKQSRQHFSADNLCKRQGLLFRQSINQPISFYFCVVAYTACIVIETLQRIDSQIELYLGCLWFIKKIKITSAALLIKPRGTLPFFLLVNEILL